CRSFQAGYVGVRRVRMYPRPASERRGSAQYAWIGSMAADHENRIGSDTPTPPRAGGFVTLQGLSEGNPRTPAATPIDRFGSATRVGSSVPRPALGRNLRTPGNGIDAMLGNQSSIRIALIPRSGGTIKGLKTIKIPFRQQNVVLTASSDQPGVYHVADQPADHGPGATDHFGKIFVA